MKTAFLVVIAFSFPIAAMAAEDRDVDSRSNFKMEAADLKMASAVNVEVGAHRSTTPHRVITWRSVGASHAAAGSVAGSGAVKSVAAPEIDPASAAAGLTLLLGGIAVLRGRKAQDG